MTTAIATTNSTASATNQTVSTEQCIDALVDVLPRLARVFKSQMRGGKLSPQQVFLLMGIEDLNQLHVDGAQPGELARRACLSSAAITAAVDDLVDGGFCVRAHSEKDRRKVLVQLTDYGRDMLREAHASAAAALRGILDGWTDEHKARLLAVLEELDVAACTLINRPAP
jgi:DNA-binding MarR family transcriptional regulator